MYVKEQDSRMTKGLSRESTRRGERWRRSVLCCAEEREKESRLGGNLSEQSRMGKRTHMCTPRCLRSCTTTQTCSDITPMPHN